MALYIKIYSLCSAVAMALGDMINSDFGLSLCISTGVACCLLIVVFFCLFTFGAVIYLFRANLVYYAARAFFLARGRRELLKQVSLEKLNSMSSSAHYLDCTSEFIFPNGLKVEVPSLDVSVL